jgi:glycine cleavage system H protein
VKDDYPDDRRYTMEGLWALVDGDEATVGISSYAQDAMGEIVYIEPPALGDLIVQGESLGPIESVKAVVEPESPLSGEVVARNEEAYAQPDLLNSSPYEAGWMFRVRMSDAGEYESLLSATDYAESL